MGVWLGVDRLAAKYPDSSPYVFSGNNPLTYVDLNGDSINFAGLLWFDLKFGTKMVGNIISDLEAITGHSLYVDYRGEQNAQLKYLKSEDGSAQVSTNSSTSSTARQDVINAISNEIEKVETIGNLGGRSRNIGNNIFLSLSQISENINNTVGIDSRTLEYGMTFLYELWHWSSGDRDIKGQWENAGPVVDHMNTIRDELGSGAWGRRMTYDFYPINGTNYKPFDNSSLNDMKHFQIHPTKYIWRK